MRTTHCFMLFICLGTALLGAADEKVAADDRSALVVEAGDCKLTYVLPPPLSGRRTATREASSIASFTARLDAQATLGYRRATIPPGAYELTIEPTTKKRYEILIRAWPPTKKKSASTKKKSASTKKKKATSAKKKPVSQVAARRDVTASKPGATDDSRPVLLRVPLSIARPPADARKAGAKRDLATLHVEWKAVARGEKLRLRLRAGHSTGTANLRCFGKTAGSASKKAKPAARGKSVKKKTKKK